MAVQCRATALAAALLLVLVAGHAGLVAGVEVNAVGTVDKNLRNELPKWKVAADLLKGIPLEPTKLR